MSAYDFTSANDIGTLTAYADLSAKQYYFVKMQSATQVTVCAAITDKPIGVLQNNPTAGQQAIVRPFAIGAIRTDDQEVLVSIPVSKGIEALGSVMAEITAQNIEIVDIGLRRPTLDDVFMELTGHKTQEEQS